MERYHIFKLGLAVTFYAAYCVRPMLVHSLKSDQHQSKTQPGSDYWVYYQGVDGRPGLDYPVYSYIPRTVFSCRGLESGYYADLDTDCQVFHICEEGKKISFLCPNGTIFQQSELICEWWNKVNCSDSPNLYSESVERLQNDVARRKSSRRVTLDGGETNHGAVMRTEEKTSVRAVKNGKDYPLTSRRTVNDIDQQINPEESNNRHLAKANLVGQARHPNHNYNGQGRVQVKKDIDKDTGNYINGDNQIRSSKKLGYNNEQRSNGVKEFGSTSLDEEKSPKLESQNSTQQHSKAAPTTQSYFGQKTKSYQSTTSYQYRTSGASNNQVITLSERTKSEAYTTSTTQRSNQRDAVSSIPVFVAPSELPPSNSNSKSSVNVNQNQTQKMYRGSVKFKTNQKDDVVSFSANVNSNYVAQKSSTTSVPPKFNHNTNSSNTFDSYDLKFPKHKSELTNTKNDIEETQVPEESSSFVRNPYNSISDNTKNSIDPYPNHRTTYSDVKQVTYQTPKQTISSITPHLVTTQPINNGKPFVGSRIGSTLSPHTYLPKSTDRTPKSHEIILGVLRHTTTELPPYGPPELFNLGSTDKTLPPVETTTGVTNYLPTEVFNVGNTDNTIKPEIVPSYGTTTLKPLDIYVPEEGSFNVGEGVVNLTTTKLPQPVSEPVFVKKLVPLLYSSAEPSTTTSRSIDHSVIYGTYHQTSGPEHVTTTRKPIDASTVYGSYINISSTPLPTRFSGGVPVKFKKGSDKVSIHLSKSLGPSFSTSSPTNNNDYVRISAGLASSTSVPSQNNFFITRNSPSSTLAPSRSETQKPRPFEIQQKVESRYYTDNTIVQTRPTFPPYQISSARPFQKVEPTEPTPYTTTVATSTKAFVYENVDNMLNVLKEIARANSRDYAQEAPRPGLVIPPSVSPQTLHSLAQYFANELDSGDGDTLRPDTKDKLTTLLTQMTVHGYNTLFSRNKESTSNDTSSTGNTNAPEAIDSKNNEENQIEDEKETEKPTLELRQLARNFSLALSSYLNDPDNFKKGLKELRPTEPPLLAEEQEDNTESGGGDEEILNFSDADIKPSTSPVFPPSPSPTWGYILAPKLTSSAEDIKNSLNPDLNTADSQSFIPNYNNFRVEEKNKGRTELPPNHWTSSPDATKLWQKIVSVDPSVVNERLFTTPAAVSEEEDATTEPDFFQDETLAKLSSPHSEIRYELRTLPQLTLNSTQVHGILLNFMNHTEESGRLQRILKKLNTTEDEFLSRMKEIESNPLTKRLILLLISECGTNLGNDASETLKTAETEDSPKEAASSVGNSFLKLVDPKLKEDDQDGRALQLLNALYSIASKFGK